MKADKFFKLLKDLKYNVGNRNGMLTKIVATGLCEGMTSEDIFSAFISEETGDPPLSKTEISRAISRSKEYVSGEANTNPFRFAAAMKKVETERSMANSEERAFVKRMIKAGEVVSKGSENYAKTLVDRSPWQMTMRSLDVRGRLEMAVHFSNTLFGDGSHFFATDILKSARDGSRIYTATEMEDWLNAECIKALEDNPCEDETDTRLKDWRTMHNGSAFVSRIGAYGDQFARSVPTHCSVNPVTGVPEKMTGGKTSTCCKKTVAEKRHALVEFDMLTIAEQCLFWIGVTATEEMDVKTIVFTCNKSLHGIVGVKTPRGDDLFGGVTEVASEEQWKREWKRLARTCCSDEDPSYRCDLSALKDCARLTRFPGGLRDGGNPQILVWSK